MDSSLGYSLALKLTPLCCAAENEIADCPAVRSLAPLEPEDLHHRMDLHSHGKGSGNRCGNGNKKRAT